MRVGQNLLKEVMAEMCGAIYAARLRKYIDQLTNGFIWWTGKLVGSYSAG